MARGGVARGETTAEGEACSGGGCLSGCGVFWRDEKVERRNPASKSGDVEPKLGDLARATFGDMKICCRAGEGAIAAFRKRRRQAAFLLAQRYVALCVCWSDVAAKTAVTTNETTATRSEREDRGDYGPLPVVAGRASVAACSAGAASETSAPAADVMISWCSPSCFRVPLAL